MLSVLVILLIATLLCLVLAQQDRIAQLESRLANARPTGAHVPGAPTRRPLYTCVMRPEPPVWAWEPQPDDRPVASVFGDGREHAEPIGSDLLPEVPADRHGAYLRAVGLHDGPPMPEVQWPAHDDDPEVVPLTTLVARGWDQWEAAHLPTGELAAVSA